MATIADVLTEATSEAQARGHVAKAGRPGALLPTWLKTQAMNVTRHAAALRPFTREEFGPGSAMPTEGHVQAVNVLISSLRAKLLDMSRSVSQSAARAAAEPTTDNLQELLEGKERGQRWVQAIERIWDFYFELFGQRQSKYGTWLLSCDRIATDCYQDAYVGLGTARSVPAPPPFCYMRTGFSPATFRRGIPLRRLGKQLNPFPLVQLPYHRMLNPWTLGAVLHEVSHNLQSDLGLNETVPRAIALRLLRAGLGRNVAKTWSRWNRETFADLSGLLLGGPEVVGSLMDVVGRSPEMVMHYNSRGPHPTPGIRTLISTELLSRLGFHEEAEHYRRAWMKLYPSLRTGSIPDWVLDSFPKAVKVVVDTICFRPYASLGNKSLSEVIRFAPKDQQMIVEAAGRLAAGTDPGIIPARYLIGAARIALERGLARPGVITKNFYTELARR